MTRPDDAAFSMPAMFSPECGTMEGSIGLTKREWFAGMAMTAAYMYGSDDDKFRIPNAAENMAKSCVAYADALIAELSKAKP